LLKRLALTEQECRMPILVSGAFIAIGGLIMTFWQAVTT
jgi:hypothetical protein